MAAIEWIRFLAGACLLLFGLAIFAIEMIGVFRFKYVLNRMHAAAMGDTLGIGFSLAGLILMSGWNFTSLKLFFVIVFLWFSSPASSHLIAKLEVTTDEEPQKHYRFWDLKELEEQLAAADAEGEAPEAGAPETAEAEVGTPEAAEAEAGTPADGMVKNAAGTERKEAQE